MNTNTAIQSFQKRRFASACLFALAILMLVVSCPLKRAISNPTSSPFSPRITYSSFTQTTEVASITQATCCALKSSVALWDTKLKTQKAPLPIPFIASSGQSGFKIPYFLSGTSQPDYASETALSFQLPLFLQHRRLLI